MTLWRSSNFNTMLTSKRDHYMMIDVIWGTWHIEPRLQSAAELHPSYMLGRARSQFSPGKWINTSPKMHYRGTPAKAAQALPSLMASRWKASSLFRLSVIAGVLWHHLGTLGNSQYMKLKNDTQQWIEWKARQQTDISRERELTRLIEEARKARQQEGDGSEATAEPQ
jgi:hypothetical protein